MRDATFVGTVRDIDGPSVAVAIDPRIPSGTLFVDGDPYSVGQVGSFLRVPDGQRDLIGIVSRVGAGAAPANVDTIEELNGTRWMALQLVGESEPDRPFSRGVAQLPSIGDRVHLLTERDLAKIYGRDAERDGLVAVGSVASASSIDARLDLNALVNRHSAVVGSTGAGKSTTVATILEQISNATTFPSSRTLLFDLHGEYARGFGAHAQVRSVDNAVIGALKIPFWMLTFDELLSIFFGPTPDEIGRTFLRDEVLRHKRLAFVQNINYIDEIELTADTPAAFSLHNLWFDLHVLLNATHTTSSNQSDQTWSLARDERGEVIQPGNAEAVIPPAFRPSSQAAGQEKIYLSTAPYNLRRQVDFLGSRLRDARFKFMTNPGSWAPNGSGKTDSGIGGFLADWVGSSKPITIVDLSSTPPTVVSEIIGATTRMIYDALVWARRLSEGGRERPLLIVFEEAHLYLGPATSGLAKTSVQRVVREGRKYGIGAMIVSQRPTELDPTILSQCGTLIAMRLTNSSDRAFVVSAAADNMAGILSLLPVLRTGEAIITGEAVPLPTRVIVRRPTHRPDSADPKLAGSFEAGGWDRKREPSNYEEVARAWQKQSDTPINWKGI